MATIKELAEEIHKTAVEKGWWDSDVATSLPEKIALMHSELSEALEAHRNNEPYAWVDNGKPEGWAVELVDCCIRVFDVLYRGGIDIEALFREKMDYNKTRSWRHGGKKL